MLRVVKVLVCAASVFQLSSANDETCLLQIGRKVSPGRKPVEDVTADSTELLDEGNLANKKDEPAAKFGYKEFKQQKKERRAAAEKVRLEQKDKRMQAYAEAKNARKAKIAVELEAKKAKVAVELERKDKQKEAYLAAKAEKKAKKQKLFAAKAEKKADDATVADDDTVVENAPELLEEGNVADKKAAEKDNAAAKFGYKERKQQKKERAAAAEKVRLEQKDKRMQAYAKAKDARKAKTAVELDAKKARAAVELGRKAKQNKAYLAAKADKKTKHQKVLLAEAEKKLANQKLIAKEQEAKKVRLAEFQAQKKAKFQERLAKEEKDKIKAMENAGTMKNAATLQRSQQLKAVEDAASKSPAASLAADSMVKDKQLTRAWKLANDIKKSPVVNNAPDVEMVSGKVSESDVDYDEFEKEYDAKYGMEEPPLSFIQVGSQSKEEKSQVKRPAPINLLEWKASAEAAAVEVPIAKDIPGLPHKTGFYGGFPGQRWPGWYGSPCLDMCMGRLTSAAKAFCIWKCNKNGGTAV